jgi:hypothetical protein
MLKALALIVLIFVTGLPCYLQAQDVSQKALALAKGLDKNKHKKKDKRYVSIEIYIDIKNEPALKSPSEYSGLYGDENHGYKLDLKVGANGGAVGSGYDTISFENSSSKMKFNLKDAHVSEAVLTGTKVYENGMTESLEAVFVNRTVATGKNANEIESRDSSFGLGFIQTNREWTNRVFLEKIN